MRNFRGPFQSPWMLKYKEKTLPSPPDPSSLPFPSLPLEVGPFKSNQGIWGSAVSSHSMGSGAEPQPKSNLVHFSLKIWHLMATILTILLTINWSNLVLEMREISVMHNFQGYFSRTFQDQSDFPGLSRSWNFKEKKCRIFHDFPGGMGTCYTQCLNS